MRIDRFLHCIRFVKSRTLAQGLIEAGHVRVDGKRVGKPAEEVREGQVIALPLRGAVRVLRVVALPARRCPPAEARCHYEEVGPPAAAQAAIDATPADGLARDQLKGASS